MNSYDYFKWKEPRWRNKNGKFYKYIMIPYIMIPFMLYRNGPTFSDWKVWANSVGAVRSGSTLFAIPSATIGLSTVWKNRIVQILSCLQQVFRCPNFLEVLRCSLWLSSVSQSASSLLSGQSESPSQTQYCLIHEPLLVHWNSSVLHVSSEKNGGFGEISMIICFCFLHNWAAAR